MSGKASIKNNLGTLSRMAHTPPHSVSTMSSSSCKIIVREHIKLLTHYLELRECLTSYFYSNISMAGCLPKKWYIVICVYNEPKLHNYASKSRHICNADKLQIVV